MVLQSSKNSNHLELVVINAMTYSVMIAQNTLNVLVWVQIPMSQMHIYLHVDSDNSINTYFLINIFLLERRK